MFETTNQKALLYDMQKCAIQIKWGYFSHLCLLSGNEVKQNPPSRICDSLFMFVFSKVVWRLLHAHLALFPLLFLFLWVGFGGRSVGRGAATTYSAAASLNTTRPRCIFSLSLVHKKRIWREEHWRTHKYNRYGPPGPSAGGVVATLDNLRTPDVPGNPYYLYRPIASIDPLYILHTPICTVRSTNTVSTPYAYYVYCVLAASSWKALHIHLHLLYVLCLRSIIYSIHTL